MESEQCACIAINLGWSLNDYMWPTIRMVEYSSTRTESRALAPGFLQRIKKDTDWPVSGEGG